MPYILGLTGNIACGKTSVGLMLLELGAVAYVDADQTVHELYLPGQPLVARIAEALGPDVVGADGGIDRKRLGDRVFRDPAALRQLEAIVHPAVQNALVGRLRELPDEGVGVLDAVKLVESGYAPFCQGIWLVRCTEATQLRRLEEQRGLSPDDARARLAAQPPLAPKLAVATAVIDNDGSFDQLRARVREEWERFLATIGRAG